MGIGSRVEEHGFSQLRVIARQICSSLLRVAEDGAAIDVEVWELPSSELGSFLTGIPAPLGLGKVQLADGRWETGFICDPYGLAGAEDITGFGGWRAYLAGKSQRPPETVIA